MWRTECQKVEGLTGCFKYNTRITALCFSPLFSHFSQITNTKSCLRAVPLNVKYITH